MELALDQNIEEQDGFKQLFQSIALLETFPQFEDLVNDMSNRLIRLFDEVEEKNGRKNYRNSVIYHPSGLCVSGNVSIVLAPWKSHTKAKEKKRNVPYSLVKQIHPLWYYQLKEYTQTRLSISSEQKYSVVDLVGKVKTYHALQPDEQALIDKEELDAFLQSTFVKLYFDMQTTHPDYDSYSIEPQPEKTTFRFLTDNELEELALFLAQGRAFPLGVYEVEQFLSQRIDTHVLHDRVVDLSELPTFRKKDTDPYSLIFDQYDVEKALVYFSDSFNKVEDPMIRKIAYRLGIIEKI